MINVCARYEDMTLLLSSFENEEDAKEFMKHDYILFYKDELEDAEEDEIIHSYEMFIDEDIPFYEPYKQNITIELDELPF